MNFVKANTSTEIVLEILSNTFQDLRYSKLVRNFFESSHGRGPQDAAGGLLKNKADMAVVVGRQKSDVLETYTILPKQN